MSIEIAHALKSPINALYPLSSFSPARDYTRNPFISPESYSGLLFQTENKFPRKSQPENLHMSNFLRTFAPNFKKNIV